MRIVIVILLFLPIVCWGQNREFENYLSKFKEIKVPIEITQANFQTFFSGSVWNEPDSVDEIYIQKFVYCDEPSMACKFITSDYGYGYGIKWNTKSFNIVILRMQRDQGDDLFNFDRIDLLLIVYDKFGKFIDRKVVARYNEVWFSQIDIKTADYILTQQAMMNINSTELIDQNKVYTANVQEQSYSILKCGIIKEQCLDELMGRLIWDKKIDNFSLKFE